MRLTDEEIERREAEEKDKRCVLFFSDYEKLEKENTELKAENAELKEQLKAANEYREKHLEKANEYYRKHKKEVLRKAKNRYRIKCGLKPL